MKGSLVTIAQSVTTLTAGTWGNMKPEEQRRQDELFARYLNQEYAAESAQFTRKIGHAEERDPQQRRSEAETPRPERNPDLNDVEASLTKKRKLEDEKPPDGSLQHHSKALGKFGNLAQCRARQKECRKFTPIRRSATKVPIRQATSAGTRNKFRISPPAITPTRPGPDEKATVDNWSGRYQDSGVQQTGSYDYFSLFVRPLVANPADVIEKAKEECRAQVVRVVHYFTRTTDVARNEQKIDGFM